MKIDKRETATRTEETSISRAGRMRTVIARIIINTQKMIITEMMQ